jgi:hypothetical protein
MAKNKMKNCSRSLAVKEKQIKTTLIFHLTPVRIASIKNTINNKCWQGCREKGALVHYWWECELVQPLWKTIWRLLKKLNIDLPYDPAIPLLGMNLNECNSGYCKGTCTPVYCSTIYNSQDMETSIMDTTDEWIKKMWYLYTMELYSATKKNKICHLQLNVWNWRTSSEAKLARLRRPKITYSPSYVD